MSDDKPSPTILDSTPHPWCVVGADGERYDRFATSDEAALCAGRWNAKGPIDHTCAAAYPFHVEYLPELPAAPEPDASGAEDEGRCSRRPGHPWSPAPLPPPGPPSRVFRIAKAQALAAFERSYFTALAAETQGNVTRMAEISDMERWHVRAYLRRHGLLSRNELPKETPVNYTLHLVAPHPSHGDRHIDGDPSQARELGDFHTRAEAIRAGREFLKANPRAWLQIDGPEGIEDVEVRS